MRLGTLGIIMALGTMVGGVALAKNSSGTPPSGRFHVTGHVSAIANTNQYKSTTTLSNTLSIVRPRFYVVEGRWTGQRWSYVYGLQTKHGPIAAVPIARNDRQHTELIAVGVPSPSLWQKAISVTGGQSASSVGQTQRRP